MNKEVSINDVLKYLQQNRALGESADNYQLLEQVIKQERETNGDKTYRMSLLQNLRAFQLKRVLANLVKPD